MSGYREHSYDPNAGSVHGRPLRPFNWVQWTGAVLFVVGVTVVLAYVAGKIGWVPKLLDSPGAGTGLFLAGAALVNSRRHPDPAPELAPARKRWMIITVAICVAILSAALAFEFAGGAG